MKAVKKSQVYHTADVLRDLFIPGPVLISEMQP